MVSLTKLAVGAVSLATAAQASHYEAYDGDGIQIFHKDHIAVDSCMAVFKKNLIFFGKKDKVGYCNVKNQPALGSMAMCLNVQPHKKGIDYFIKTCSDYNLTEQAFWAAYDNATKYAVKNLTGYPGFNKSVPFNLPVQFKNKTIIGAYDSTLGRWYNYNRTNIYSWVLLAYWLLLVLVAGACRLAAYAAPNFIASLNGKVSNTFRKYVTMPALFGRKRAEHGRWFKFLEFVIPSRIETIQIFVWFILCLAFNVANFHHDSPNIIWKQKMVEMSRKISDRSGIFCLYMIPQMILFAGRNNFMMWISGWSYARFNVIHHWYGRILFILMVVHSVAMTYSGKGLGKYKLRNSKPYVQWGYVALVASSIMCFHSLAVLRKRNYELFVLFHNILGAFTIAGTWLHVKPSDMHQFMICATAVWAFDKVLRFVRMAWFGVRTADVQLIADETLKVKVPRPAYWKPYPLCHAYIYFFRPTCFWQSHPFTVVDSAVEDKTITLCLKVKGGMTHGLYRYLSTQPGQRAQIKCSVEGPYGSREPLQHYKSVSFLCGGNGIPGLYAGALDLAKRSSGQNVKLYWIIRHWKSIEWFYEELARLESTSIQPIVYVTQYNTPLDKSFLEKADFDDNTSDEKKSDTETTDNHVEALKNRLSFVEFRAGRPDVTAIIQQDIAESSGSVAVVACGHNSFVDEARKVTIDNLPEGKRVDFFDQMETW